MKPLLLICFLLIFTAAALGQPAVVRLYIQADAGGDAQSIPVGSYRVDSKSITGSPGESVHFSVKVEAGYTIEFCTAAPNEAPSRCEEFGEGVHNLTLPEFSIIKVKKAEKVRPIVPPLLVFEQRNWLGRSQTYGPGMYRASRTEFGKINDDQVRSIVITPGYTAKVCVDEGVWFRGAGICEEYGEGKWNIRNANDISFIEVLDLNDKSAPDVTMPVLLYEDPGLGGKLQGLDIGAYTATQLKKLVDSRVSSVMVKKDFHLQICSSVAGAKACEEFGPGKHDRKVRDKPDSVRVSRSDQ